jgi:hypothetical protein
MELKLFREELENVDLYQFCSSLHEDGPVNAPFHSVCAVEMIDFFAENYKNES